MKQDNSKQSIKKIEWDRTNGPLNKLRSRAMRYSGFFGVRSGTVLLEMSWKTDFPGRQGRTLLSPDCLTDFKRFNPFLTEERFLPGMEVWEGGYG